MSHEEFFKQNGNICFRAVDQHGPCYLSTVEQMYQAFKARLIAELLVDVHNCPVYGRLVPKEQHAKFLKEFYENSDDGATT